MHLPAHNFGDLLQNQTHVVPPPDQSGGLILRIMLLG